jgi:hypothetical protein
MKIMQIVYPGLGGNSSVAFSLVEGQKKNNKIKNFFLFCGIEKLIRNYKYKCAVLNINYFYLKKHRYRLYITKILKIIKKNKPNVIVIHDYNLIPFFFYSLFNNVNLIYVHHTPDKTKKILDWLVYIFNSFFSHKVVLVSKRNKNDFIFILNKIFFSKKVNIIENGINTKKFKK